MRRVLWSLAILVLLSSTNVVIADSHTIEIESLGRIESHALALNDAQVNPQGDRVLAVGDEGYAILLDADSPATASTQIKFDTGVSTALNSVAWHTGGKTAFLAGDSGVVLRYVENDQSIENVDGTGMLEGTDIKAISWRNNGDRAYLGGEGGRIYSYDAENGFLLLDQTADSTVTSIACHRHHSVCIVTTLQDGVAIIDRDSQVHWLGSVENTWLSAVCSDSDVNECVVIASGRRVSAIILKPDDAGSSIIEPAEIIGQLSGEFTGITSMRDDSIAITMAPYGLIQYRLENRNSYKMLEHDLVKDSEIELSSTSLVQVWGDDITHGFIISSDGSIAQFTPTMVEEDELIMKAVMLILLISVPGCVIGLIFMNSKTLQGWYYSRRKARRVKAQEKATELEKQKAASKKNKAGGRPIQPVQQLRSVQTAPPQPSVATSQQISHVPVEIYQNAVNELERKRKNAEVEAVRLRQQLASQTVDSASSKEMKRMQVKLADLQEQVANSEGAKQKMEDDIKELRKSGGTSSLEMHDSVIGGDSMIGSTKIENQQIINDPEAIARAAIEAYRMAKSEDKD